MAWLYHLLQVITFWGSLACVPASLVGFYRSRAERDRHWLIDSVILSAAVTLAVAVVGFP